MSTINEIRDYCYKQGYSINKIHLKTGIAHKTIRKYLEKEDFNIPGPIKRYKVSKLEAYYDVIDTWLKNDKLLKPKQRHSAQRVYARLLAEYPAFTGKYRIVASYVKEKRKEIYSQNSCYIPLEHPMGEAQVDFGKAEYIEHGEKISGSYLVMSFPYSNAGYAMLFPGETTECLLDGMQKIFKHIGAVPYKIWFDNASSIVTKIHKENKRDLTELFLRFKNHYGFTAVFCNPYSGNEKGHVENKVGYIRKNFLVPIPEFTSINDYNEKLLNICDKDMARVHYKKKVLIEELFVSEKPRMLPLNHINFEVCRYHTVKADLYGKIKLDKGERTYSTMPSMAGSRVTIKQTALKVYILNNDMEPIIEHKRLYGKNKETMNWQPYLIQLSRKPRAIKYTSLYQLFPSDVQNIFANLQASECGKILKSIAEISNKNNMTKALDTVIETSKLGKVDADTIITTYNKMHYEQMEFTKVSLSDHLDNFGIRQNQPSDYDMLIKVV